ncbi:hypothetical protein NUACC26_096070 [Scytonema sp. NUACC26]
MLLSSITMSNSPNVAQVFNIFADLTKSLKAFIKTDDLRIVFDSIRNKLKISKFCQYIFG